MHAIKALAVLATAEEGLYVGAQAIAQRIRAPGNYLGKLLQLLARSGLVEGRKGLQGGFRLSRPASEISLYDVVEPIEQVSRWSGCFLTQGDCRANRPCRLHTRWSEVRRAYIEFLRGTLIKDVAASLDELPPVAPRATSVAAARRLASAGRRKKSG